MLRRYELFFHGLSLWCKQRTAGTADYCSCENEHQKNSLNYWVSQYGDTSCMASISLQREGNLTKELFQYGGFLMPSDKLVLLIRFSFNNKTTNKTIKQLDNLHWLYLQHPRNCLLKTTWIKEQTDHFTYNHDCHKHTGLKWFYSGVGKKQNSPTVLTQGWQTGFSGESPVNLRTCQQYLP